MHPKTVEFLQKFTEQHGTGKVKHGHKGTIDPADLKTFASTLIANAKTVPPEELPALIDDLGGYLDTAVDALTN